MVSFTKLISDFYLFLLQGFQNLVGVFYFKLLVLYLQGFKNLAGRQYLSTTIGKMDCFLALIAEEILFW